MNEYTRREEVRWTLITAVLLVICIAGAIALLTTAKGATVPDPVALTAADEAESRALQFKGCTTSASKLVEEIGVFRGLAKAARIAEEEKREDEDGDEDGPKKKDDGSKKKDAKDSAPDASLAWLAAQTSHKHARALAPCRKLTDDATQGSPDASEGWAAVLAAAETSPPGDDPAAQVVAAKRLLVVLGNAPIPTVVEAVDKADAILREDAERARERAASATIREPLPQGLLGRKVAIAVGLGLSLVALLVSFFSVRAASIRRAITLIPLRKVARTDDRGMQAAAILQLAAQPNGGEPGLVIGAAVGGLVAAALSPLDADWFVAGVMGGLVLGLTAQLLLRLLWGQADWRARAIELAEIEKPAIPVVLVLGGVMPGMEAQFIDFFMTLQPQEAAAAVEKLAAQAEERILAAADAGALQKPPR